MTHDSAAHRRRVARLLDHPTGARRGVSMLSVRCRHRYAGGFQLDAAFDTEARVTALFGPTGSGKTTLLSIVAGLLTPDEGAVTFDGEPLLDTARRVNMPPERRRIGYVFQDQLLFPHLSVRSNLGYGRVARKLAAKGTVDFEQVVQVLELQNLLERHPHALSGGERQRVALGRALLSEPRLLLMDEPLASLDEPLKLRILDYLQRIVDEWRIPTLFVSHSPAEVRKLAHWVVVVERGKLLTAGPADSQTW